MNEKANHVAPTTLTQEIDGKTYTFGRARVPQLDRYLSKASKSLVTASITLALDMARDEDKAELKRAFDEKPGLAVQVASAELERQGFKNPSQD